MNEKGQEKAKLAIDEQPAVVTLNNPPVNALDNSLPANRAADEKTCIEVVR